MFTLGFFKIKSMPLLQMAKGVLHVHTYTQTALPWESWEWRTCLHVLNYLTFYSKCKKKFSSLGNHYSSPLWRGESLCSNCCLSIGLFPLKEMKSSLDVELPWSKALSAPSCGSGQTRGGVEQDCGWAKLAVAQKEDQGLCLPPQPPRSLSVTVQGHTNVIKLQLENPAII